MQFDRFLYSKITLRGKVQYGFQEFRIRPLNASDKDVAYHRSGFNEYHGDIAKHDEELKKRMENEHELYETPVYNEKTEFGNVELGKFEFGYVICLVFI